MTCNLPFLYKGSRWEKEKLMIMLEMEDVA